MRKVLLMACKIMKNLGRICADRQRLSVLVCIIADEKCCGQAVAWNGRMKGRELCTHQSN